MARTLNGSTDRINCGNISQFPSGASAALTGSAWVYATAFTNAYNGVISKNDGTNYVSLQPKSTGKLALYFVDNGGTSRSYDGTGTNTLSTNTWYHLAFTIPPNAAAGVAYVNGSVDGSSPNSAGGIHSNTASLFYGTSTGNTDTWTGRIADGALWNVVLTAAEILALSKGARPWTIRPSALISYLPLDGLQSPEPDLSGNKNNGTLTGTSASAGPPIMMFTSRRPQFIPTVVSAVKPWPPFQLRAA